MLDVIQRLKNGEHLVSDGAFGTMLYAKGLEQGKCPEEWNISHPDVVRSIAAEYIQAGSDMVLTNTFQCSRFVLAHHGYEDRVAEFAKAGASLAKEAAGDNHIVAASIGPTGKFVAPLGDISEEEMRDAFSEQFSAVEEGGADAICIETMTDLQEAVIAVRTAKDVSGLPVFCTMTFDRTSRGYFTVMGVSIEQAAKGLCDAGADVIGSNCGNGIEQMIEIIRDMRQYTDIPILCHSNAGLPEVVDGEAKYLQTPEIMSGMIKQLKEAGANIIGGCCGTTPLHISAMAPIIKNN